ncbi:MAG: endo-1,4-beta-xylanase [Bacteroidetes bacterium]|nr:endo-1,4-beta-xylanase [Bacteroidota bacterium]
MNNILPTCKRNSGRLSIQIALTLVTAVFAFAQIQTDVPALKDVYANDFTIGCLLSYAHVGLPTDPYVPGQSTPVYADGEGGELIRYHMNSMSPGNWMKSTYIVDINGSASAYNSAATQAEKDSINIHPKVTFNGNITAQLNWAKRQGFTFRGHTLVWHNQTPGTTFFRTGYTSTGTRVSKDTMTLRMGNYIKEVIRQIHEGWPGLLSAMDVVNEAVTDGGSDRTSESEWYVTFGDNSYIMKAFEFARQYTIQYGETQMKLYYNDYNTSTASKANGIVRVCGPIFRAGLLDGIGMQEHDQMSNPNAAQWIASYDKFDTICTEMAVTELDISTSSGTNYPSDATLATQARQYGQLFKCFVERSYKSGRGKIINVSKDGLNDEWTFVKNQSSSLWNTDNQCKPAFYAVVSVGMNYNALDSLIFYADTIQGTGYSPESWASLSSALSSAKNIISKNYSSTVSAADSLEYAKNNLEDAITNLVRTGVDDDNSNRPTAFVLGQNYPNPFNPKTVIRYSVPAVGTSLMKSVKLKIYDQLGREIATLVDGIKSPGVHTIEWNAQNMPSGVYFYRLNSGKFTETKKMILLK